MKHRPYRREVVVESSRELTRLFRDIKIPLRIIRDPHGYCYFLSTKTGHQVGSSIYVYSVGSAPVSFWILEAQDALRSAGIPS